MVILPCAEVAVIRYASLTKRKRKRNRKNEKSHLMKRRIVFA
jgi:hypothetical protein